MTSKALKFPRRNVLQTGSALIASAALMSIPLPTKAAGHAQPSYTIDGQSGEIKIIPLGHASLMLQTATLNILVDPVGGSAIYKDLPDINLILITHAHGDHYSAETLTAVAGRNIPIISNAAVFERLDASLQERTVSLQNSDFTLFGDLRVEAVPAYNFTEDRLNYHPKGRDNGYILELDGVRIYIAGDTEDTPEMRALTNIDLAFIPMNLPFTMTEQQAADGVLAFAPKVVFPYHYRGSDSEVFKTLVDAGGKDVDVRLHDWYA